MPIIIFFSFFILSSNAFASKNIFTIVGEKVELRGKGPFHFSSKDGIKVFLNSQPPFFTTSKVGLFEFYQKNVKFSLFSLNEHQHKFQKKIEPLVKQLVQAEWKIAGEKLILTGRGLDPEIKSYLITTCNSMSDGSALLDFGSEIENQKIPLICLNSLKPKSEKKIKLLVIESSKMNNSNYGLGVPSSIKWQLENSGKISLPDLVGETNLNNGKINSQGDLFFSSHISKDNPVTFEAGSEVGIQQNGLFNRQATEWKKATTTIHLEMSEDRKEQTKIKVSLEKRSRTGQGLVFEIEKLNKSVFLEKNIWKKVLIFNDSNKSKGRNGIFGLGFTGSANRSRSKSNKEVWLQVSDHD